MSATSDQGDRQEHQCEDRQERQQEPGCRSTSGEQPSGGIAAGVESGEERRSVAGRLVERLERD